jgi:cation diffusion facilitator family transporter
VAANVHAAHLNQPACARSVAIMSDAAHMLSDVSSFLVAIFAAWAATQPSTMHYSFGYHRAEILGALVSVLIIWLVTGALVYEAIQRTIQPVEVDGKGGDPVVQRMCCGLVAGIWQGQQL